jgi:hypothetical protein
MSDTGRQRGHPEDAVLFGSRQNVEKLKQAAADLAWLFGRGYARDAALKLVGDRYRLHARQRLALSRSVASPAAAHSRRRCAVAAGDLTGRRLQVDAFNQIITIETALSGGLLLRGNDGALRDLAGVHGSYRTLEETRRALEAIGQWLAVRSPQAVVFLIDAVVSNSGRLAAMMRRMAEEYGWPWCVKLVTTADPILKNTTDIVATSDSTILDRAPQWFDLASAVVEQIAPEAWCLVLDRPPPIVR